MEFSFVTRKFQRSIAGLSLLSILASFAGFGMASANTYTDVSSDYFAYDQIDSLSTDGIMTGYENGEFGPNDTLTREQAAKILVMASVGSVDESYDAGFTDVTDGMWYTDYVNTAALYSIVEGYSDGSFGVGRNVNRAEFAKMAVSAGLELEGTLGSDMFGDVMSSDWFDAYVGTAWAYSIIDGYDNGNFGPGDWVTRGQAAKITYNSLNPVLRTSEEEEEEEEEGEEEMGGEGGDLEVILSSESPDDYTYFAAGTNAEVAVFELTASNGDVDVSSFSVELAQGDNDSILSFAIYNEQGARVSKVDNGLDSDDMARMSMLDGSYVVESGESELFRLYVTFADMIDDGDTGDTDDVDAANTSTLYAFTFDSSMIESDAASVEVEDELMTGIFGLLDENVGALEISHDGSLSKVDVGESGEEIMAFTLTEESNEKDVWLSSLTFENVEPTLGTAADLEDAIRDPMLVWGGDVISEGTINGDYISFMVEEGTVMIGEGKNEDFSVEATIIGESGNTLAFDLEETLDVMAVDEDGYNVVVVDALTPQDVDIEAGSVTVIGYDAEADKFRPDRDEVELGRFEVTANNDGLQLEQVNIDITGTNINPSDAFDNFEVVINGQTYDLDLDTAGLVEAYNADIDKLLTVGTVYEFVVQGDTVDEDDALGATSFTGTTYSDISIEVALNGLGTGTAADGLFITESEDDDPVTDITPSVLTFNQLDGETAGVDISVLSMSTAKDVVVGGEELALEFEVEEVSEVSEIAFREISVEDVSGTTMDSTNVSQVKLVWVDSNGDETTLDTVTGNDISSETATFDEFDEIIIAAGESEKFRVYLKFVDDENNDGDTFQLALKEYDVEDDEGDVVYDAGELLTTDGDFSNEASSPTSARIITLVATGILFVEIDNDASSEGTDDERWVGAGEEMQALASLSLKTDNEDVELQDFTFNFSAGTVNDLYSKFYLVDEDGATVASDVVSDETGTFSFEDEIVIVTETEMNYTLYADMAEYGEAGTSTLGEDTIMVTFVVDEAEGVDSGNTLNNESADVDVTIDAGEVIYEGADNGTDLTSTSNIYGVAATYIADLEFVSSYSGVSVASSLTDGDNVVAILALTAADTGSEEISGDTLDLLLSEFNFDYSKLAGTTLNSATIERIGGDGELALDTSVSDVLTYTAGATPAVVADDFKIEQGETAYFTIEVDVTRDILAENDDYFQVELNDLEGGTNIEWFDSILSAAAYTEVRLGMSNLDADKVSESN